MKQHYEMEMPCQCRCGEWFDLDDGYPSTQHRQFMGIEVVCRACHDVEERIYEIEREIEYLETFDNKKREIKKLQKELDKLKAD